MKPCTCGVKFTGGLCSDWCDSLRPDEVEAVPETLPSPFDFKGDSAPGDLGVLCVYEDGQWRVWRGRS